MARKTKSIDGTSALPDQTVIIRTTFEMIAEKGFDKTRLSAVATRLNAPSGEIFRTYGSVQHVIDLFLDGVDKHMIDMHPTSGTKRDIYFDMLMNRFDELQSHRAGVKRWLQDVARHPRLAKRLLRRWEHTLSLILDIGGDSPVLPIKKLGLAFIYSYCLREWLRDDTEDMSKTMSAVDRALGRAEDFATRYLSPKKSASA